MSLTKTTHGLDEHVAKSDVVSDVGGDVMRDVANVADVAIQSCGAFFIVCISLSVMLSGCNLLAGSDQDPTGTQGVQTDDPQSSQRTADPQNPKTSSGQTSDKAVDPAPPQLSETRQIYHSPSLAIQRSSRPSTGLRLRSSNSRRLLGNKPFG